MLQNTPRLRGNKIMRLESDFKKRSFFSLMFVVLFLTSGRSVEAQKIEETPEVVEAGKKVYEKKCIHCHGEKGDGKGPAAPFLFPPPRDFTRGIYKIKSTPRGELPLDEDLFNIITRGMPGSSMPGWDHLSYKERWGLVYFIKTFSERFTRAKEEGQHPSPAIKVGDPIPSSPESIKKGEDIFFELECDICHGNKGRGDGFKALKLKTKWGGRVLPRNLTRRWLFRRSADPKPRDIYLTVRIGVEGTPMPSFAKDLDEPGEDLLEEMEEEGDNSEGAEKEDHEKMSGDERTWHLVNYVLSLSEEKKPEVREVYNVKKIEGPLPDGPFDKQWGEVMLNEFPLVGQVITDPRMFTPRIDFVQLKGLYNKDEIAFLLIWHDPSGMTLRSPGKGLFPDAIALQLPQKLQPGARKPYFLNGDPEEPVYLLHWSADKNGISEMNGTGIQRTNIQDEDAQDAKGVISFKDGEYRLLIKRPLKTDDKQDLQFVPGKFIPIAFSAWEGSNGETETKRSISAWYYIILETPLPQEIFFYPFLAMIIVAVAEVIIIRHFKKQKNKPWIN